MTRWNAQRGVGLVELLVGTALGLVVLSLLTFAVATGSRLLVACGARGEGEDTAHLAIEAFTFDARRAGWDPAGAGIAALAEAQADRVGLTADLDGDGVVDPSSEENVVHACVVGSGRLSRIVGRQSMPLAEGVTACRFRYLGAGGLPVVVPAGGLDASARAAVTAVALDLTLVPAGLRGRTERSIVVALRRRP